MKATKVFSIFVALVLVFVLGYMLGRHQAIRQAELIDANNYEYHIGFGNEIHTYTFE
jgi:uncharacterized membrane protein